MASRSSVGRQRGRLSHRCRWTAQQDRRSRYASRAWGKAVGHHCGVYVVETKSVRKPKQAKSGTTYNVEFNGDSLRFPDFTAAKPLEQAERCAQWVAVQLRELQINVPVISALALPGWHIDQPPDVWRASKVKVFTPMGNGANFMAKDLNRIDGPTRGLIAKALALRYPKIGSE